ncbi:MULTISPECIES: hypothetical protein [Paenibacillus]|nr:hypothetical protein [Paenibacillus odorifer]
MSRVAVVAGLLGMAVVAGMVEAVEWLKCLGSVVAVVAGVVEWSDG